jgi:Flp pilus assembly protein TadG
VDTYQLPFHKAIDIHDSYDRRAAMKEIGMCNRRDDKKLTFAHDESGAVSIVFAFALTAFFGFLAMAFDIGHIVMVKTELQRTADAAALGGAMGLIPYTGSLSDPTPNWSQATDKAKDMINNAANQADNQIFTVTETEGIVDHGYWMLTPSPGYAQLTKVRPPSASLPQPAVKVSLNRNVNLDFAPLVGITSPKPVSATATAILPEAYSTTGVPPIAVTWDTVYNDDGGTLEIDLSDQTIKPQSNKGVAGWFNLNGGNSVPSVRIDVPLIADPTGVATGSQVYLLPGTKATLTEYITEGSTVVLPVVDDVSLKDWQPIKAWAAFHVDTLNANSMEGHFVDKYFDPFVRPTTETSATAGGVAGTPKLVSP